MANFLSFKRRFVFYDPAFFLRPMAVKITVSVPKAACPGLHRTDFVLCPAISAYIIYSPPGIVNWKSRKIGKIILFVTVIARQCTHCRGNPPKNFPFSKYERLMPSPAWRGCRPQAAGVEGTGGDKKPVSLGVDNFHTS